MSTRSKKTDEIKMDPAVTKKSENSWVILIKDCMLKQNKQFSIISLPHPGSGDNVWYCLDTANKKVYEVAVFDEPHRSWFIGESVKSDGKLHLTTLVNPTFLVLPKLIDECSTRAVPLDDLLCEESFAKLLDFIPNLDHVADLKGPADLKAYKYNEEKTIKWLETRVRNVARVLRAKNIHVTAGATSATFVKSSKDNDHIDEEFFLKYAHGLVSQYLTEDLAEKLEKHFNFKPDLIESLAKKRKSEAEDNTDKKKIVKTEPMEQKENYGTNSLAESPIKKQKVNLNNKEKALKKAASGTKTISSFFSKK